MAESAERVVLFNSLTVVLLVTTTWVCGVYLDINSLHIIAQPLQTSFNISCILVSWNLAGFYMLQKFPRMHFGNVISGIIVNCLSAVLFHVALVAFGAPLTKTVSETFHFALLLTCLTTLPCCLVLGMNTTRWGNLFLLKSPPEDSPSSALEKSVRLSSVSDANTALERSVWWCTVGAVTGAWLGAVPIPLDWDRPWQAWPISCLIGALGGYCAGAVCAVVDILVKSLEKKIKDT